MMEIKRGNIYLADLNPIVGSEQGGERPVIVVQNDIGNRYSPTSIVIPVSSRVLIVEKVVIYPGNRVIFELFAGFKLGVDF